MWWLLFVIITILVVLISYFKVQPFLSFLFVSIITGLAYGLNTNLIIGAVQKGIGSTLGAILPIILIGAMIGKIIAKTNASIVIADQLIKLFGPKRLPFAFMIIGFIVSMPLFFSVAFLLLTPLVLTTAQRQQMNPVYLGIPMLASLSITQGFLPPHPAPYYLVTHLEGAEIDKTLGWGIVISIPAMLLSGWLFGMTLKTIPANPMNFTQEVEPVNPPSFLSSLTVILLPVLLISTSAFFKHPVIELISEPNLALFFSLIVAMYILGFRRGVKWDDMRHWILDASKEVTPLILTFAGAGAFKEILQLMNIGNEVMSMAKNSAVNPLFLGWLIAAMLRVITGSSTVAGITTAGIILPVVLSHVNDTGFWLFKEYFGVSVKHTLRSWTVMETILAVAGLVGVLVLQKLI